MEISTVFQVKSDNTSENFEVNATGQNAANVIKKQAPKKSVVKLLGFLIDGVFKKADLTSHWERTALKK